MEHTEKRSAIIGCGAISRVHATALIKRADTEIVAVCDTNAENAEKLLTEVGFKAKIYTDYEKMLDEEMPDFVHICTPHFLHVPQSKAALSRGINVICEKPVCMNKEEFEELSEAVGKSKAKLSVSFQNRFLRCNEKALEIISSGEYGKVKGIRGIVTWDRHGSYYTESGWRGKKKTEGGSVLMNQSIHTLDLMHYFCGEVEYCEGVTSTFHMKDFLDTEDTASIYLKFSSGAVGVFFATTAYAASLPITLDINLEKARLTVEGSRLLLNGEEIVPKDMGGVVGKSVWGIGHERLIDIFYTTNDPPVPLESVRGTMDTIWKIYSQN